jgi:hypothetical protein
VVAHLVGALHDGTAATSVIDNAVIAHVPSDELVIRADDIH